MSMKTGLVALTAIMLGAATYARADISPSQIYQENGPAVVLIICADQSGQGELGTGSIINKQGQIITNAHVIVNKATGQPYDSIHVYFKPAHLTGDTQKDMVNPVKATALHWDRSMDLALLQIQQIPTKLVIMPIGDSDLVNMGDPVVAIGHPEQGGLWTLTSGVISTVLANLGDVQGKNVFQTDASINRGNSGGPLIDRTQGAMIGINTSMARKASDGLTITSVNFSIESNVVKTWLAGVGANVASAPITPSATIPSAIAIAQTPAPAAPIVPAQQQAPAAVVSNTISQTAKPVNSNLQTQSTPPAANAIPNGGRDARPPALTAPLAANAIPNGGRDARPPALTAPLAANAIPNGGRDARPPALTAPLAANAIPNGGRDARPPALTAPPAVKIAAHKPVILTPVKPYSIRDVIAEQIADMETMEKEMQQEIDARNQGASEEFKQLDQEAQQNQ